MMKYTDNLIWVCTLTFLLLISMCLFYLTGCGDKDIPRKNEATYLESVEAYKVRLSDPDVRYQELIKIYHECERIIHITNLNSDWDIHCMRVQVHIIDILERRK